VNEAPQQYTQRILSYIEDKEPLAIQAATAEKLNQVIKGVAASELRRRPAPEKWSANEIVAHLADAEIVIGYRLRLVLGSPGAVIVAYDGDTWAVSGHYDERDTQKSVELFRVVREVNLLLLKSLKPEQWKQYGMHSERGQESIEHMVRMHAGHDINHLQQIEKTLAHK
jgi:hypothetical protein